MIQPSITHLNIKLVGDVRASHFASISFRIRTSSSFVIVSRTVVHRYDVLNGEITSTMDVQPAADIIQLSSLNESDSEVLEESQSFSSQNETSSTPDIFDECPFRYLDPWDNSLLKYIHVKYGFEWNCSSNPAFEPITKLENGHVTLVGKKKDYKCFARCLYYKNDDAFDSSNWESIATNKTFDCDFVETKCKSENDLNRFIHMQISEQKSIANASKARRWRNPDVHIIAIDSIGAAQFIRALPRTVNFLLHGMDAVEFRKLNKVGSNTRPNAFPLLLGKTTEPVDRRAMNLGTIEPDFSEKKFCQTYLDDELYIPKEYRDAGYMTLDAQDYVASILYYPNCYGLKKKAAHHYYRPFHLLLHENKKLLKILKAGRCRESMNYMLDFHTLFLNSYKAEYVPKFALTWLVEVAHDDTGDLYKADYDLYKFFLKNRKKFSNSFIIFLGDHGPRFGEESNTPINDAEQRNPFLYIVLPEHLRYSPMHEQLMLNSKELLTHHDLHATLKDILYFQPASNFTDLEFKVFESNRRGSSVLRRYQEGVKRNCKTLPIPFQYCICQYVTFKVEDEELKHELGLFAADQLDSLLKTERVSSMCEDIKLGRMCTIDAQVGVLTSTYQNSTMNVKCSTHFEEQQPYLDASRANHTTTLRTNNAWEQVEEVLKYGPPAMVDDVTFHVTFVAASPANGTFQVPVRKQNSTLQLGGKYTRLDWYGSSANCMSRDVLRPYCTCKSLCALLPTLCQLYGHLV